MEYINEFNYIISQLSLENDNFDVEIFTLINSLYNLNFSENIKDYLF